MATLTKRMVEVLAHADLDRGTISDVPQSTARGLERRKLIEPLEVWPHGSTVLGRFPHVGAKLTAEGLAQARIIANERTT